MKANLHTHTTRCGHAVGADEDYVRAALTQHFDVLGFSDHVPWPYTSGYTHESVRMTVDRLPEYVSAVRALAERYRGQIRVLAGFECEYFPAYMGWLAETAEAYKLDYLILGNHYDESDETGTYFGSISTAEQLSRYVKQTVKGLEPGLFTYLAHPDLFMHRWPLGFGAECRAAARDLCDACLALNVPMEYNTHMRYAGKGLPGACLAHPRSSPPPAGFCPCRRARMLSMLKLLDLSELLGELREAGRGGVSGPSTVRSGWPTATAAAPWSASPASPSGDPGPGQGRDAGGGEEASRRGEGRAGALSRMGVAGRGRPPALRTSGGASEPRSCVSARTRLASGPPGPGLGFLFRRR